MSKQRSHDTEASEQRAHPRVLQVLGGSAYGGGTEMILAITRALVAADYDVTLVASDPETLRRFSEVGIRIVPILQMRRAVHPVLDVVSGVKLIRLIRGGKYDVVHTHTSKAGLLGRFAAWVSGVPVIIHHVHGFSFHAYSGRLSGWIYRGLERLAARWCDVIISVNKEDREDAARLRIGRPGQVITIENGVRKELLEQTVDGTRIRRELGVGEADFLVGFVGRLFAQKDPATFIRAAGMVCREIPNAHFAIAGEGPDMARMQQLARDLAVPHMHFLGFRRDIPELLAGLDVFCLTSRWEGLPISVLEAMGTGLCIVATDIKGTRELIVHRQSGVLVPPGDPGATARAILDMQSHPDTARDYGVSARTAVAQRYTEDRMQNRILDLYSDCLRNVKTPDYRHTPVMPMNGKADTL